MITGAKKRIIAKLVEVAKSLPAGVEPLYIQACTVAIAEPRHRYDVNVEVQAAIRLVCIILDAKTRHHTRIDTVDFRREHVVFAKVRLLEVKVAVPTTKPVCTRRHAGRLSLVSIERRATKTSVRHRVIS